MLCPTLSVKLTKWSIKYPYIVPKICQKPYAKTPQKTTKIWGKNLL